MVFANNNVCEMYKERPVLVPGHQRAGALGFQLLLATLHIHVSVGYTSSVTNSFTHYNLVKSFFSKTNEIGEIIKEKKSTNLLIECFLNDAIISSFNL